jgi:hypothetical protein
MAEMNGAAKIEVQETALHALKRTGSRAFLPGRQYPLDKFNQEFEQVKENIKKQTTKPQ